MTGTGREHKKRLLELTADIGKVNGMRAGAEILRALIQDRKRIDTAEIRAAAMAMEDAATKLDARVKADLRTLGATGIDEI